MKNQNSKEEDGADQDQLANPKPYIEYLEKCRNYKNNNIYRFKDRIPDICNIDIQKENKKEESQKELTEKEILTECENIIGKNVKQESRKELKELLIANKNRYARTGTDCGLIPNIKFRINLKEDATPTYHKGYPQSFKMADEALRQTKALEKAKFVRKCESEWAHPYIMVPKPTRKGKKEWRMYRLQRIKYSNNTRSVSNTIYEGFIQEIKRQSIIQQLGFKERILSHRNR